MRFSDLWRWNGTIDRGAYLAWGLILFAIKFNLDRLISEQAFFRSWSILDYHRAGRLLWDVLPSFQEGAYYSAMVAASLPFLWAGVVLTVKRLRSAGLPQWPVILFVIPILKLALFALLTVIPSVRARQQQHLAGGDVKGWLGVLVPRNSVGSAALGIAVSLVYGVVAVWAGATFMPNYAWSLFVGVPFCMGFCSVFLYGYHEPRSWSQCLRQVVSTLGLVAGALLILAFEGIICIIMAAPLALVIAGLGGAVAYRIQSSPWWHSPASFCAVLLVTALTQPLESTTLGPPPILCVRTTIEIDAAPERVWRNVVSFSELPPPTEWFFKLGIAYPKRATIVGEGPGAVRYCEFSTGAFVEPIEIWSPPALLKFSVTSNPAPMEEWTLYDDIHPPHLEGFLQSRAGQFQLVPLPGHRTLLEGTTWYQHRLWPVAYWQWWSDAIIHRIHRRVLNHIKQLSESSA